MKTISIANITEIKAVYLVCCKCGTKTSISVYTRDKRLRECVECQEPFDSAVIASAIDFAGFKMQFERLKSENKNGADIVFEME